MPTTGIAVVDHGFSVYQSIIVAAIVAIIFSRAMKHLWKQTTAKLISTLALGLVVYFVAHDWNTVSTLATSTWTSITGLLKSGG